MAAILLQHFRWNEDRLLDKFMDSSHGVLREVGEPQNAPASPELSYRPSKRARIDTQTEDFMCVICCDIPSEDDIWELRCGHKFCVTCWKEYVQTKIKQEGQCMFKCMQDGCATTMDGPSIEHFSDPATHSR